eukprot:7377527-Prymnesium_polylepis.1
MSTAAATEGGAAALNARLEAERARTRELRDTVQQWQRKVATRGHDTPCPADLPRPRSLRHLAAAHRRDVFARARTAGGAGARDSAHAGGEHGANLRCGEAANQHTGRHLEVAESRCTARAAAASASACRRCRRTNRIRRLRGLPPQSVCRRALVSSLPMWLAISRDAVLRVRVLSGTCGPTAWALAVLCVCATVFGRRLRMKERKTAVTAEIQRAQNLTNLEHVTNRSCAGGAIASR